MRVHRSGGAEDDHRRAIAPGIEDRHGRVHQPDVGVQRYGHRFLGDFAIAVGDRHGVLLVQADNHLRIAVAEIVDDAVVKTPVARARHQGDVFQVDPAGDFSDHVATPLHLRLAKIHRPIDRRVGSVLGSFRIGFLGNNRFHRMSLSALGFAR